LLQAENLLFAYPGGPALIQGVSLKLAAGELVGLCGPNGSGKTTLLRLLSGRLAPQGGRVTLGGREVASLKRAEVARQVGVVAQNGSVAFPFRAEEVVLMGRAVRLRGLFETEEDLRVAREALALTGTLELAPRPFAQLSGGERQRVLIARALAQEPALLLLDEPAAFLDLRHQIAVFELLARLAAEKGLAVLAVSHDLGLAARFCPRLLLLGQGRVAASGTPEEVLRPDIIEAVFGLPVAVERDAAGGLRVCPLRGRPA
jgi:iron complex transport system ATP-binding protein